MDKEQKIELLAEIFECELEEITPSKELSEFDNWDSMTKLSLIVMMDDEFEKTLIANDINKFKTIKDVLDFME